VVQELPLQPQPAATPVKKARLRPLSEQLLGRNYPRLVAHDDDEGPFISFYLIL
jgi:serine/arginine repetitive matrix protein 2